MPRNLIAETLRRGLYTRVVARRILFFQELGSTMDEARLRADSGCDEGTLVLAETQTASRGRFNRTWVSRAGNLYLSIIFYPSVAALPFLSSLGGVAVARAIRRITGLQLKLKWPNDVLIEGSKVAGILVESAVEGNEVKYAVLGIGINVNIDQQHLVGVPSAASLNNATGKEIARDQLLTCLLHEIDALYFDLKQGQTPLAQWKGLLDTLGQQVNVTSGDHSYSGLAEDIDEIGNLQVRMDDGQLVTLTSGDVTLNAPVADVKP